MATLEQVNALNAALSGAQTQILNLSTELDKLRIASDLDLGVAKDLGNGWGVNAHYGYQYVKNGKDAGLVADNASDYRIGATKDLSGWVVGASLVGTSKKDFALTASGKDGGKTGLVLSLSKTF